VPPRRDHSTRNKGALAGFDAALDTALARINGPTLIEVMMKS
jgi:hypothetical protein